MLNHFVCVVRSSSSFFLHFFSLLSKVLVDFDICNLHLIKCEVAAILVLVYFGYFLNFISFYTKYLYLPIILVSRYLSSAVLQISIRFHHVLCISVRQSNDKVISKSFVQRLIFQVNFSNFCHNKLI